MAPAMCFPWVVVLAPLGASVVAVVVWLVVRSNAKSRQPGFPIDEPPIIGTEEKPTLEYEQRQPSIFRRMPRWMRLALLIIALVVATEILILGAILFRLGR